MELHIVLQGTVGLMLAAYLILYFFNYGNTKASRLPPGPRPWPILGNLPLLFCTTTPAPHRALARLSRIHGPIFTFHLGSFPALIISSPSLAKEFLLTHDHNFADRPSFGMSRLLLYGQDKGVAFTHHGPRWRKLRQLFSLELFGQRALQQYQHVRHEEVACLMGFLEREAKEAGDGSVEVRKCMSTLSGNIIARILVSTRLVDWVTGESNELHHTVCETASINMAMLIGDYVPSLAWLDARTAYRMRQVHRRLDKQLSSFVAKRLREARGSRQDFLDVLLDQTEQSDAEALDSVKSILVELFAGGIDTTSIPVEWAMAELLQHPGKMKKLQLEIDEAMEGSKNRMLVEESDLERLPYLKALVKEIFRLHPPGPLLVPHASQHDCEIMGYRIPAKTRLLVNVWALASDPSLWNKPHAFEPERFLNSPMDVMGQTYELLPFGSGRRICPGIPLAVPVLSLALANMVHKFHWTLASPHVDMSEDASGPLVLATPLRAIPTPRLSTIRQVL